ncbi:hypothetical protein AYO21_06489 [Fonsecaea monophora]|uniref:Uncharacterized protein n=1 Tax=Fonsecaea monophora TaxID=254056 RepID=A0A177F4V8_9EURO|nr:hypothetical protein AYO21_06489 [Fonsecaea monophora]OAG39285.1 hypothetical protein AYO21_06489 [Fonsecaea monophora]
MPGLKLNGASAIVTGAGSGINLAFAKTLVEKGCNVLIADIGLRPEAQALIDSVNTQKSGAKVVFQRTDVTDWAQLEETFDRVEKEFETVPDLLILPEFQQPGTGFWGDKDSGSRYKVIDVNLIHPMKMTRIAIRRMLRAKKTGVILHVASVAAETLSVITPLYQASKHGIGSFVMGMSGLEGLCGIRVLGVAPGSIKTPLLLEDPKVSKWIDPTKDKLLDPSVIAQALLALAENVNDKYPPGTLLEVTEESEELWRSIPLYNNPGPPRLNLASNKDSALTTIKQMLEEEKGER